MLIWTWDPLHGAVSLLTKANNSENQRTEVGLIPLIIISSHSCVRSFLPISVHLGSTGLEILKLLMQFFLQNCSKGSKELKAGTITWSLWASHASGSHVKKKVFIQVAITDSNYFG